MRVLEFDPGGLEIREGFVHLRLVGLGDRRAEDGGDGCDGEETMDETSVMHSGLQCWDGRR